LSYAYLHAVASRIRATCWISGRHPDNRGIDAELISWGPFDNDATFEEVSLHVQLKATIGFSSETETHYSYFFKGTDQYNDLTKKTVSVPRILVVLHLHEEDLHWLNVKPEQLILKNCAYWVSLRGGAASTNKTGETVYIPKTQLLTPDALKEIFSALSKRQELNYVKP
jgi:hypothetical protein